MSEEQELAQYLYEETIATYPEGGTPPPEADTENMKSYLARATAIVKFLRAHGLL